MSVMTLEELRATLPEWQRRLRLQDWTIVVEYVRKSDADGWWGELTIRQLVHRFAQIRIVDPATWQLEDHPTDEIASDPEYVLVHELVHIYTDGTLGLDDSAVKINRGSARNIWAEQSADAIARALIGLKRGDLTVSLEIGSAKLPAD